VNIIKSLLLATLAISCSGVALADSPLADAIQAGNRLAALELIEEGADVAATQGDGTTPLHWAVYKIDVPLVEALLARGANAAVMNDYGASPLTEAVKVAHAGLVERLLEAGADPESPNLDGQTALMVAARAGSVDIARQLVAHGADVNAREAFRGQTALMWAAEGRHGELTGFLVEHGADVGARGVVNDWAAQITSEPRAQYRPTGGLTPLIYAARAGCIACVDAILEGGEDIDRHAERGALRIAREQQRALGHCDGDVSRRQGDGGAHREAVVAAVKDTHRALDAALVQPHVEGGQGRGQGNWRGHQGHSKIVSINEQYTNHERD
jgi:ankyrin repeat protein